MTRCSSCREIRETVRFHDPQHGFARVCEACWEKAGREKGWTLVKRGVGQPQPYPLEGESDATEREA